MADKQNTTNANEPALQLTATDLATIIREAVEAAKAPYVDKDVEARVLRNKERMRTQLKESAAMIEASQSNCSHLRDDNTSRIAWTTNFIAAKQHFMKEGFCMACNKHFKPGVEDYAAMLRVPTGRQGLVT